MTAGVAKKPKIDHMFSPIPVAFLQNHNFKGPFKINNPNVVIAGSKTLLTVANSLAAAQFACFWNEKIKRPLDYALLCGARVRTGNGLEARPAITVTKNA